LAVKVNKINSYNSFSLYHKSLRLHRRRPNRRKNISPGESGKISSKELYPETGFYYYGARYLDPRTSRWLSGDPALGEYLPGAPVDDEAKKNNQNLPGQGGVFNLVNLHVYHYAGNNPVKYVDPDGRAEAYVLEWSLDGGGGGGGSKTSSEEPVPKPTQVPNTEALEFAVSTMIGIDVSKTPTVGDGITGSMNVLSTYTGIMAEIADTEGLVSGASGVLNGVSVATGVVATVPSALNAKNDPSVENISKLAGNVANVAFGSISIGLGGLAGASTSAYVKAGAFASEGGAKLNDALTHRPLGVLQNTFNYLVRYK
jgi:hypothetical protein